jgi:C1A family cysteine protease
MNLKKLILKLWKKKNRKPGKPTYICNIKQSPPDDRDNIYATKAIIPEKLPIQADNSAYCTPVKQQGKIGSCGSHAFATAMEMCQNKEDPRALVPLSELFHYYVVRGKDYGNTYPADSGQYLRDGAKVCNKEGISPEKLCPYDVSKYNDKPSMFAYSFAKWYKIAMYSRCWTVTAMLKEISEKHPVVFGIVVQDSIFSTKKTGDVTGKGSDVGGHALCAVGYDDMHLNPDGTKGAIRFINSWGKGWGNNGYGWISYSLLKEKFLEAWAVVKE